MNDGLKRKNMEKTINNRVRKKVIKKGELKAPLLNAFAVSS
jgi:hypothetical protein